MKREAKYNSESEKSRFKRALEIFKNLDGIIYSEFAYILGMETVHPVITINRGGCDICLQ